ncbi:MAG: hypothetical protein WCJ09_13375, partial [Planctomycetota bacterium]
ALQGRPHFKIRRPGKSLPALGATLATSGYLVTMVRHLRLSVTRMSILPLWLVTTCNACCVEASR